MSRRRPTEAGWGEKFWAPGPGLDDGDPEAVAVPDVAVGVDVDVGVAVGVDVAVGEDVPVAVVGGVVEPPGSGSVVAGVVTAAGSPGPGVACSGPHAAVLTTTARVRPTVNVHRTPPWSLIGARPEA